jgi:hypothetical protein
LRIGHTRHLHRASRSQASRDSQVDDPNVDTHVIVEALRATGYSTHEEQYLAVEAGELVPADPRRFLDAFTQCLELTTRESVSLRNALAFAILVEELGIELASYVFSTNE